MFCFPISDVNADVSIRENNNGNNFFSVLNILDNNWEYVKKWAAEIFNKFTQKFF